MIQSHHESKVAPALTKKEILACVGKFIFRERTYPFIPWSYSTSFHLFTCLFISILPPFLFFPFSPVNLYSLFLHSVYVHSSIPPPFTWIRDDVAVVSSCLILSLNVKKRMVTLVKKGESELWWSTWWWTQETELKVVFSFFLSPFFLLSLSHSSLELLRSSGDIYS